MKYLIATRTRRQLLTYSVCETLEQAKENIKRYGHIWRIGIYSQDSLGNIVKIK